MKQRKQSGNPWFLKGIILVVSLLATGIAAADVYDMTADCVVGEDINAVPTNITPTLSAGAEWIYDLGTNSLYMSNYNFTVSAPGVASNITMELVSLTCATNGGSFNLQGNNRSGDLTITAGGIVTCNVINTYSTHSVNNEGDGGDVTITAPDGITVAGTISTTATGSNNDAGSVLLVSTNGLVSVGELIITSQNGKNDCGNIEISAESITASNLTAASWSSGTSTSGGDIELTAFGGNVVVNGNLRAWGGARSGGGVVVSATGGDVLIAGGISNQSHVVSGTTYGGGDIELTSVGGNISVGRCMCSTAAETSKYGNVYLTASTGSITLDMLDVSCVQTITIVSDVSQGTTISGAVLGLSGYLASNTVTRFTSVTGNIYYDPQVPANAYLGSNYYIIAGSEAYYLGPPPVIVANDNATFIATNTATLNGELISGGQTNAAWVSICWGVTNAGTNYGVWANKEVIGVISEGQFSTNITGLDSETIYYYRCFASNEFGNAWASGSGSFETLFVDLDGDGMSDAWETFYFTDTSRDGAGDYDGEGLNDLQEFLQDANPTDPDTDNDGFNDHTEAINDTDPSSDASKPSKPYREWSRIYGTPDDEGGYGVSIGPSSNVYVSGYTGGQFGGETNVGLNDLLLVKLAPDGTQLWVRIWGSASNDYVRSVEVDDAENIYSAGITEGAFSGETNVGLTDATLTKWDVDGTEQWSCIWGSADDDTGNGVAVDSDGNIYVAGHTQGEFGGQTNAGNTDFCLTKWAPNGTQVWARIWGSAASEYGYCISVDGFSNVCVAGSTDGGFDGQTNVGGGDVVLTKWRPDGTKLWTRIWGSGTNDCGLGVVADALGDIYVTGYTAGEFDGQTNSGGTDIFITRWGSDGAKQWTRIWGSASDDVGESAGVDGMSNVYVSGYSSGVINGQTNSGDNDVCLTKLWLDGTKLWTRVWGSATNDYGLMVGMNPSGAVYVTGETFDSFDGQAHGGAADLFVSKWVAALTPPESDYAYKVFDGAMTIAGYDGPEMNLIIPSVVEGMPVTRLRNNAFFWSTNLISVVIPDSVINIDNQAFSSCWNLTDVFIGKGVVDIDVYVFRECYSLTNIAVDSLNTTYSSLDGVLFNKDQTSLITCPGGKLGDYIIPSTVTAIEREAFQNCKVMSSVTIPDSVTSIDFSAFSSCDGLTSVFIPHSVVSMGSGVFSYCDNLTNITVDAINPNYSSLDGILFDKNQTKLIKCPGGRVGDYAIPDTVTNVFASAFSSCDLITSVTIPANVVLIGAQAFRSCNDMTNITVNASNTVYYSYGGVLYDGNQETLVVCPGGKAGACIIPWGITNIEEYAFYHCLNLTSVIMPDSVVTIKMYAFFWCNNLATIIFPAGVISIGDYAFSMGTSDLEAACFKGDAPNPGVNSFGTFSSVIVYYRDGTTGWGATYAGRPTALWPKMTNSVVVSNKFTFDVSGSDGQTFEIEKATNLLSESWNSIYTGTLSGTYFEFEDDDWTNRPAQFYRVTFP